MQLEDLNAIIEKDSEDIKAGLLSVGGIPSIERLKILTVSLRNYKPLVHDKKPLQGKHLGLVIALMDKDLIRTCTDLDKNTEEFTLVHEMVHLIRKDLPQVTLQMTYKSFAGLPNSDLPAIYRSHSVYYRGNESEIEITSHLNTESQFRTPREYITEQVASDIIEFICEQQRIGPKFGYGCF